MQRWNRFAVAGALSILVGVAGCASSAPETPAADRPAKLGPTTRRALPVTTRPVKAVVMPRPVARVRPVLPARPATVAKPAPAPAPAPVVAAEFWDGHGKCEGIASFYAGKFLGRRTASGEKYTGRKLTAAHRVLAFNTYVKVTNLDSGLSVVVRINDRGPYIDGRVIDLSPAAARKLHMIKDGVVKVKLEVVAPWMAED